MLLVNLHESLLNLNSIHVLYLYKYQYPFHNSSIQYIEYSTARFILYSHMNSHFNTKHTSIILKFIHVLKFYCGNVNFNLRTVHVPVHTGIKIYYCIDCTYSLLYRTCTSKLFTNSCAVFTMQNMHY